MTNFVLVQFVWLLSLAFFIAISYFIVRTFTNLPFHRRFNILFEILLCIIVFAYLLAFRVNF